MLPCQRSLPRTVGTQEVRSGKLVPTGNDTFSLRSQQGVHIKAAVSGPPSRSQISEPPNRGAGVSHVAKLMMVLEKPRVETSPVCHDAEMMMVLGKPRVESPISAAMTATLLPVMQK